MTHAIDKHICSENQNCRVSWIHGKTQDSFSTGPRYLKNRTSSSGIFKCSSVSSLEALPLAVLHFSSSTWSLVQRWRMEMVKRHLKEYTAIHCLFWNVRSLRECSIAELVFGFFCFATPERMACPFGRIQDFEVITGGLLKLVYFQPSTPPALLHESEQSPFLDGRGFGAPPEHPGAKWNKWRVDLTLPRFCLW